MSDPRTTIELRNKEIGKKMTSMKIYHKGIALTLFVFPYPASGEWDVEIHSGHVDTNTEGTYIDTLTLERETHIIADMWDAMDLAISTRVGA